MSTTDFDVDPDAFRVTTTDIAAYVAEQKRKAVNRAMTRMVADVYEQTGGASRQIRALNWRRIAEAALAPTSRQLSERFPMSDDATGYVQPYDLGPYTRDVAVAVAGAVEKVTHRYSYYYQKPAGVGD